MIVHLFSKHRAAFLTLTAAVLAFSACHRNSGRAARPDGETSKHSTSGATESATGPDACQVVLVPHSGVGRVDRQIIRLQTNVRNGLNVSQSLENLGWVYVAKARETFDPGYYKVAEQCALCLESRQPQSVEALLLRGHVLQNLHKFKEAEPLARELIARRGASFDYGLLGDVLMEEGRLGEAASAYQEMVDERPNMQAYARIAHLRWLKGDLAGATELMQLAVGAASPNAPESAAWVNTRLAWLQFQHGNLADAVQTCESALAHQAEYAPALLLRGRLLLADGRTSEAIDPLTRAGRLNPLPEYQWVFSEALRAAGRQEEAAAVEKTLRQQGASADPRTFAVYLASRGESNETSLKLAREEFKVRSDIFTHDALAWALAANGQTEEAWKEMQLALREGTKDARLFFHATVIAAKAGHHEEAGRWLDRIVQMMPLLLPSEQQRLQTTAMEIGQTGATDANSRLASTFFTPEPRPNEK